MKKIIVRTSIVILLILAFVLVHYAKILNAKKQEDILSQIKNNNSAFTLKVLDEYNNNLHAKASTTCQKVVNEMNEKVNNPFNKKEKAYTYDLNCKACTSVEYQDKQNSIIITTIDSKEKLISRTIIKPPSFVTYSK